MAVGIIYALAGVVCVVGFGYLAFFLGQVDETNMGIEPPGRARREGRQEHLK